MSHHVYVATPTKDWTVSNAYVDSLRSLALALERRGHRLTERRLNGGPILLARNLLATSFLRSDATHLLFLDADVGYVGEEIARMLDEGVDVVGGVYPLRAHAWDRVPERQGRGLPPSTLAGMVPFRGLGGPPILGGVSDELVACDYVPNGCMSIHRSVLEEMIVRRQETGVQIVLHRGERVATWFDRSHEPIPSTMAVPVERHPLLASVDELHFAVSEDATFCRRWRSLGGFVWCDPRLHLAHVGPCSYEAPSVAELFASSTAGP